MNSSDHELLETGEVELVEHLCRGPPILGDALGGRVVDKRRGMSEILTELDAEVEKDVAANVASVRLEDVDGVSLDLFARPPPMDVVEGVVDRAPRPRAAVVLGQVELPRRVGVSDEMIRGTRAGEI